MRLSSLRFPSIKAGMLLSITFLLSFGTAHRLVMSSPVNPDLAPSTPPSLVGFLTDPILQDPQPRSIRVVWFTEFEGDVHLVHYGPGLSHTVTAASVSLSHLQEDAQSWVGHQEGDGSVYSHPQARSIWRHTAIVTGLEPGVRWPYQVESQVQGQMIRSDRFMLAPSPPPGQPLKLLLTSDHQLKPMVAANLEKVATTVGQLDGIFMAGDLVNIPDRASEWFDDRRGGAFFPALQGRAAMTLSGQLYRGAPLLQSTPLFPALGNHEVMGRRRSPIHANPSLNQQFEDPLPKTIAMELALAAGESIPVKTDPNFQGWLEDRSFNWQTLREIWHWPQASLTEDSGEETEPPGYYAVSFGDVRLVVLFATNIWRPWGLGDGVRGRYRERTADLSHPDRWGYGQHIFEPIAKGSEQYQWLEAELASSTFQQARYKVIMLHHPIHTLGDNGVPAYTDPVSVVERDAQEHLTTVSYEYPLDRDYLNRDLVPLFEAAGVDLVLNGHCHLWNRFQSPAGLHFLETSNVGNSYGAFWRGPDSIDSPFTPGRPIPRNFQEIYAAYGDPWGLDPILPTIAPLTLKQLQGEDLGTNLTDQILQTPLPYIASNDITVFSILDTAEGSVSSYYFDTRNPGSEVVLFDRFELGHRRS